MSQVSTIPTAEEHEVMAAAVNAVLVRCQQVGRAHMTPQDARVATTVAKAIMSIGPAENVVTLGAPQTQPNREGNSNEQTVVQLGWPLGLGSLFRHLKESLRFLCGQAIGAVLPARQRDLRHR